MAWREMWKVMVMVEWVQDSLIIGRGTDPSRNLSWWYWIIYHVNAEMIVIDCKNTQQ
jgi:hypothetical protein